MAGPYSYQKYREPDGTSRYEEFENSLQERKQCLAKALHLLAMLKEHGTNLPKTISKDIGDGVWELKGRCRDGGVRIYYWRSGETEFTLACGEVKDEDEADPKLVAYAKKCKENQDASRRGATRPHRGQRRRR